MTAEKATERDPLKRTKRIFGGLIDDVRIRYPKYWSDIKDGIALQCLASFFIIYFACLSSAITFGGILSGYLKVQVYYACALVSPGGLAG